CGHVPWPAKGLNLPQPSVARRAARRGLVKAPHRHKKKGEKNLEAPCEFLLPFGKGIPNSRGEFREWAVARDQRGSGRVMAGPEGHRVLEEAKIWSSSLRGNTSTVPTLMYSPRSSWPGRVGRVEPGRGLGPTKPKPYLPLVSNYLRVPQFRPPSSYPAA
ncbi:Elongation factor 2, partial [Frankliniella fusca]